MRIRQNIFIAALLGVATYLALFSLGYYLGQVAFPSPSPTVWPVWYGISRQILESLVAVAPGFVAGWVAGRSGMLIGAIVGVVNALLTPIAIALSPFGALPFETASSVVLALAIGGVITGMVAGAAGHLLRAGTQPSNYSFKATVMGRCDNPAPGAAP